MITDWPAHCTTAPSAHTAGREPQLAAREASTVAPVHPEGDFRRVSARLDAALTAAGR